MTIVPGRCVLCQTTSRRAVAEACPPNRRSKKFAGVPPSEAAGWAWADPARMAPHAKAASVTVNRDMRSSLVQSGIASTPKAQLEVPDPVMLVGPTGLAVRREYR